MKFYPKSAPGGLREFQKQDQLEILRALGEAISSFRCVETTALISWIQMKDMQWKRSNCIVKSDTMCSHWFPKAPPCSSILFCRKIVPNMVSLF